MRCFMSCRLTRCCLNGIPTDGFDPSLSIAIGSDHRGFALKAFLQKARPSFSWIDVGTFSPDVTDYPEYAQRVCSLILEGTATSGVLLCGSGVGMSIAANRNPGIYGALCFSPEMARLAKEDDNANVLIFPASHVSEQGLLDSFDAWREARFKGGRYADRLAQIDTEALTCVSDT